MYAPRVHVLQAIQHPSKFGFQYNSKPYLVGFLTGQEAVYATKQIALASQARFVEFHPRDVTQVVRCGLHELGVQTQVSSVMVDENAILKVQKIMHPQFDWILEEELFDTFLGHPFAHQTGVVLVKRKLNETVDDIMYAVEVVQPSFEAVSFQRNLENLY